MTKDLLRPKRIAPSSLRRKGKKRKSRLGNLQNRRRIW
jgi:hypothetical protein